MLSYREYKERFLPFLPPNILFNNDKVQVHRIQNFLRGIVPMENTYKTTFGFIIFVNSGFVSQQLGKKTFKIEKKQCINIQQGIDTRTLEVSDDAEGFVVIYQKDTVTCSFNSTKPTYYQLDCSEADSFSTTLHLLEKECVEKKGRFLVTLHLLNSLISRLIDYQVNELLNIREIAVVTKFKEQVEKHYTTNKSVIHYADLLAISPHYLTKAMKTVTRKCPKQWIDEYSIEQSKLLLQNFSKNVSDVAYELNYESSSYFIRLFKKHTGITPNQFRKKLQSKIISEKNNELAKFTCVKSGFLI